MKGLNSREFLKISLLADFRVSLNFILLQPNVVFSSNIHSVGLLYWKITVIMPCYDFVIKLVNLDFQGMFRSFKWRTVLYFFVKFGKRYWPNSFCIVIHKEFLLSSSFFNFRSWPMTSSPYPVHVKLEFYIFDKCSHANLKRLGNSESEYSAEFISSHIQFF